MNEELDKNEAAVAQLPRLAAPARLHHAAYVCQDAAETAAFYTDVLGMELCGFIIDDKIPSTGDAFPYVHLFFKMGDGSNLAFFESVGLPPPAKSSHPAYDIFNHIALNVETRESVDAWIDYLKGRNIEVIGPIDHGVIYSAYFHDPNGVRLELTATTEWTFSKEQSLHELELWTQAKEASRKQGDIAPLTELISSRRARHK